MQIESLSIEDLAELRDKVIATFNDRGMPRCKSTSRIMRLQKLPKNLRKPEDEI